MICGTLATAERGGEVTCGTTTLLAGLGGVERGDAAPVDRNVGATMAHDLVNSFLTRGKLELVCIG